MRHLWLLVLGACSADIAPGVYYCGPEQLCPEGLTCDGVQDLCVTPSQAQAFDCQIPCNLDGNEANEVCPDEFVCKANRCVAITDDVPTTGFLLEPALECVSGVREIESCLSANDPSDWFQFDIPDNCTKAVQIEARVTFPTAHEPIAIQLSSDGGAPQTVDTDCKVSTGDDGGRTARCFELTVGNGSHHVLGLVHSGVDNCDGECAFNRYQLNLQLSTP